MGIVGAGLCTEQMTSDQWHESTEVSLCIVSY